MNQKAGEKCKAGERGHPCRVPGILAGSPHLGFRRLLSKRGKEGLFFTWTWENRCFVSQGRMLKEEESQGPIFTRDGVVGVGSPLGLGRC